MSIVRIAFIIYTIAAAIYYFNNKKSGTRLSLSVLWKWISGTLLAIALGRTIYIVCYGLSNRVSSENELLMFIVFTILWGIVFTNCSFAEKRLRKVNQSIFRKISRVCVCGNIVECCQKIEYIESDDDIIVLYQIYCHACGEKTAWHKNLDDACVEWRTKLLHAEK